MTLSFHFLRTATLFVMAIVVPAGVFAQSTWYVDDDAANDPSPGDPTVSDPLEDGSAAHPFDAIQEGVDAAADGDTVLVLDGTYTGTGNRDIDFNGKAILVTSETGPQSCIVDCQGSAGVPYRGFHFHNGETESSVLEGLTIRNGYTTHSGGGILCTVASAPKIIRCVITSNEAEVFGGGIACVTSTPQIVGCEISENVSYNDGGGVHLNNYSHAVITNCMVLGNVASSDGGGLRCLDNSHAQITNCVIANNTTTIGAGVSCPGSSPRFAQCTIVNNKATSRGGGIWSYEFGHPNVRNSIVWGNSPDQFYPEGSGDNPRVYYCDVQGGWSGITNNVMDSDPLFVDPDGADDDPNTYEDNDYRLTAASPCIDAGCNWQVPADLADLDADGDVDEFTPYDLDDEGRFFDEPGAIDTGCGTAPIVDMGAYEFGGAGPQPCFADFNGDHEVNLSDLAELLSHYGSTSGACDGDLDCDGDVELSDLAALLAVYGSVCD